MADSTMPAPQSKAQTFVRRTSSTLLLWAVVTTVFLNRSSWAFLGLTTLLVVIATLEYSRMLKKAGIPGFPIFSLLSTLCYSGILCWDLAHGRQPMAHLDLIAIATVTIGAFILQLRRPIVGNTPLVSIGAHLLGFIYIPVLFHFASRLLFIAPNAFESVGKVADQGAYLLLWLVAVTKFTDMGAYITGSLIGRHKMIPHVSPAKTWEGFGGALAFAQLAGIGLYKLFPQHLSLLGHLGHVMALGLVLALLAVVGDLAESIIKRSLGAKDSGQMLPGIGGSLDLIDSICFTAPALFCYLNWFLLQTP